MGLLRKMAPRPVRKVRRAAHPVRATPRAVTPRPGKKATPVTYAARHPARAVSGMRSISALPLVCALALVPMGVAACGSSSDNTAAIQAANKREQAIEQKLKQQEQQGLAKLQHAKRQAQKAKQQAQEARQAAQPPPPPTTSTTSTTTTTSAPAPSNCDPNYTGACLQPNAVDYDCEGGSGDGPLYTGQVTVVGTDHYGLDSNSNGVGCE
jgi:hypothetical protein